MKDYHISTAAFVFCHFPTAFPLEVCVQKCFVLKYITNIFLCKCFWFLVCVGPVFPVRTRHGDVTSAACETSLWNTLSVLEGCFICFSHFCFFLKM